MDNKEQSIGKQDHYGCDVYHDMMMESDVICIQTFQFVDFFLQKVDEFLRFAHAILRLT